MNSNRYNDAQKLSARISSALDKLSIDAHESGKRIYAIKNHGNISVLTALEGIELDVEFIQSFQQYFSPIKSYANKPINDLNSFIRSNKGLDRTIESMFFYLKMGGAVDIDYIDDDIDEIDEDNLVSKYADTVYGNLLNIKGITHRGNVRTKRTPKPYCAFCWRRIEDSNGYCQVHHPHQSKNSFNKALSALIAALKNTNSKHFHEYLKLKNNNVKKLAQNAYNWTNTFAAEPSKFLTLTTNVYISDVNFKEVSIELLKFTKKHYPLTFSLLNGVKASELTTCNNYILEIIKALDPIESSFWEANNIQNWMSLKYFDDSNMNILALLLFLQRHEAYTYINSLSRPRGQQEKNKNNDLRDKIKEIAIAQKNSGKKLNCAEIGREINLTRQRVNELIKEMNISF